jgi:hypothetical protein
MEEDEKKANKNIKSDKIKIHVISITVEGDTHKYVPEFTYDSILVPTIGDTIGTANYRTFKVMDRFIHTSRPNEIEVYVKLLT